MTPAAALDYVRSRRPRVLLAPSQWKVYHNGFLLLIHFVRLNWMLPCTVYFPFISLLISDFLDSFA